MTRPTRSLAVLAGVAALALTGVAPASAARWSHADAVGDVQTQTDTLDSGTGQSQETDPVPAPGNTDTDVTHVSVRHRPHRLRLSTSLRDLTADSGVVVYDIRTPTRRYGVMQRLGTDTMFPAFTFERPDGRQVRCAGVERNVDRAGDTATLTIPRACLGRPRWVRVGVGVAKFEATRTVFTILMDDALQDAVVSDDLALSPRVRRS